MTFKKVLSIFIINLLIIPAVIYYGEELNCSQFRFSHIFTDNQSLSTDYKIKISKEDELNIFFQSIKKVYFYLILFSPFNDDMQMICPDEDFDFDIQLSKKLYLTSEESWFRREGKYYLYYIFTEKRLNDLESEIKELFKNNLKDQEKKIIQRIFSIIREKRRKNELLSNINDLPSPIVGTIRNNQVVNNDRLMKLGFSETDTDHNQYLKKEKIEDMKVKMDALAEKINFCDVFVKEMVVEYCE